MPHGLLALAGRVGASVTQATLRWHLEGGPGGIGLGATVPQTSKIEHLAENLRVLDFAIGVELMHELQQQRVVESWWPDKTARAARHLLVARVQEAAATASATNLDAVVTRIKEAAAVATATCIAEATTPAAAAHMRAAATAATAAHIRAASARIGEVATYGAREVAMYGAIRIREAAEHIHQTGAMPAASIRKVVKAASKVITDGAVKTTVERIREAAARIGVDTTKAALADIAEAAARNKEISTRGGK